MSHIESPWTRLASRTARALLTRKGATYEDAVIALRSIGVRDSPKSLELRVQRGSLKFSSFLQLLCALHADLPCEFQRVVEERDSWESACQRLVLDLLTQNAISLDELARRLDESGIHINTTQVQSLVSKGSFSLAFLLQVGYVLPIRALERYVDLSDIAKAASESVLTP
ncbi:conserved hypothetical protein [Cupriavidus taiwanensis]|uniref:DUF6471 domain-containing protein n=1 Tax=Cupriavidus taiwanensis TaxID=164546 RepID=A0A375EC64_9BURK|nr:conserved hypothetical protein [Cupriavidus taiwanensis]SOZ69761.1 conserved hypothetical protein [Cupriavidus taiwanensis]SOZ72945.1 conserved hypothetical protein [Cupriavidus taiwanensis]SPA23810.1 conserved hypothetical protein [Cupriavidus taiwanensis]